MKIYTKIAFLTAALAVLFSMQSCLKDQEDVFDKTPAERMNEYLNDVNKILQAPENGWVMYLFPIYSGSPTAGFIYTAKFDGTSVTFRSERDGNGEDTATSYYRLNNDNGPCLSFDTFNSIYHYWATPAGSGDLYKGRGGDVDLVFMEVSKDKIVCEGKRLRGRIEMYPLEQDPESYIKECIAYRSSNRDIFFGVQWNGSALNAEFVDDGNLGKVTSNPARYIEFSYSGEDGETVTDTKAFVYLPDRIRFYKTVKYNDLSVRDFKVDFTEVGETSIVPVNGEDVRFTKPLTYLSLEDFAGDYTLTYEKSWDGDTDFKTIDLTLAVNEQEDGLILKGLNEKWQVNLTYDQWSGVAYLRIQDLGLSTKNAKDQTAYPRFCFADASYFNFLEAEPYGEVANIRGSVSGTIYENCVFSFIWDYFNVDETVINLRNTYTWSSSSKTRAANSWYIHTYSSRTGTTDRFSLVPESGFGFGAVWNEDVVTETGVTILPYVYNLTKK